MNTHSADKQQNFIGRVQDVEGVSHLPGIGAVKYAGVTEVTEGDLIKVMYTHGYIQKDEGLVSFRASANNPGHLQAHEMKSNFIQSVSTELQKLMTDKSLPSD